MPPSIEELAKEINKREQTLRKVSLRELGRQNANLEAAEAFDVQIVNDDLRQLTQKQKD